MVSFNIGLAGTLPRNPAMNVTSSKTILNIFHHDVRSIIQIGGKNRERIQLKVADFEIADF
jgi:hypothetical protein